MGQRTKTKFCYGFILPQKQLVKLFAVLQDSDNEIQEFLDWDELQELQDLVSRWLESEVPAFEFVVELTSDDDGDDEECEMMFCYQGKYNEEDKQDGEQSGVFSLEIWGRESNKTSLEVIPQPWEDEAFMKVGGAETIDWKATGGSQIETILVRYMLRPPILINVKTMFSDQVQIVRLRIRGTKYIEIKFTEAD
ncbi:hypothetical protein Hypma_007366 [Hypsizygus marmoreus]|uniref:Uncharacterized protein n=1 Tax=Hypsizygus marmoreus TaxID=39966 RepID=A0A369JZE9_HYPMA|nr:hypothetical protein Hypma_007366 [Hypsizygus marmoreus]